MLVRYHSCCTNTLIKWIISNLRYALLNDAGLLVGEGGAEGLRLYCFVVYCFVVVFGICTYWGVYCLFWWFGQSAPKNASKVSINGPFAIAGRFDSKKGNLYDIASGLNTAHFGLAVCTS